MKEKVKIIVLIIIFVIVLLSINVLLNNKNSNNANNISKISEEKELSSMKVLEVNNENFEKEVLESEKPVLIDFFADWCGPCKMLSPIVKQIAEENEQIKVVKINIDNEQDLAVKYGIMSIPTLVVIKNGQESSRSVGLISKEEILELIK